MSSTGSVDMEAKREWPQESVIGPYVWNLRMDVLMQQLEQFRFKFSALPMICCLLPLLVEGNSTRQLEEKSADLMQIAADCRRSVGVEELEDKTLMMHIKGSRHIRALLQFAMDHMLLSM